jgi:O-antigen/teichoic acid export membrane protein
MLYAGLLTGLQRQVLANTVLFSGSLLRGFGSIGVLLLSDNSVVAFFSWQLIGNLLELGFAMYAAWATQQGRFLAARFTLARLKENRRFAGGVVYITLTAAAIAQIDKFVFSKLLSLEQFGYYALGATVAYGVFNLVYPICIAASPKFTHLLHSGETRRLSTTYHQFAQMCTVMAIPAVVILVAYAPDALALYLQDRDHALKVEPFLRLITLGVAAAALAPLPHTLQIAGGWTRLVSACNTVFALLYLSALLLITPSYGVEVALIVWIVLNAAYLLGLTWFMHQRILPGEFHVWLCKDVGVPAALGVAVCYLASESLQNSALPAILQISVSYTAVLVATMGGCMHVRRAAWMRLAIFVRQA